MKRSRIGYYYNTLFYSFYRLDFVIGSPWKSHFKAILALTAIEVYLFFIIVAIIKFTFRYDILDSPNYNGVKFSLLTLIAISKYIQFLHNDKWKFIIEEYESLSPVKKKRMFTTTIVVVSVIILSILLLVWVNNNWSTG